MVNGLGSQCINYATEWCERFVARGLQVIRFDNRDVGLSTHFDDVAPTSRGAGERWAGDRRRWPTRLADMADDVIAVLDELGVDTAHVMGLSMGGMIVQHLAIDHADRLRSITSVMSSTGDPDVGQRSPKPGADDRAVTDRPRRLHRRHHPGPAHVGQPGVRTTRSAWAAIAGEAFDRSFDPAGSVGSTSPSARRRSRASPARVTTARRW